MLIKICKLILFSKEMLEQYIRPCASEQGFPRSHPTSSHNLNKTIPQMSFYIAYKHQGRCACCINITFLTIQNRQWQNTKPQTHSMTVMYVFKCLVHSEGPWLQPVALQDSRWAESQKLSLSTTLRLCAIAGRHMVHMVLAEHSWKTSLKYKHITLHSESKGAESQAQTETISHQPLLHPHPPNTGVGGCAGGAGG